jgi:hypothetical protein
MSSETTVCPGCNNTFTLRGYQSHLAQSNDPLCSAVFDQLKKAYEINQDDSDSDSERELSDDEDHGEDAEMEQSWEPTREGAPDHEEEDIGTAIDNEDNLNPGSETDEDLNNQQLEHENRDRYIIGDGYGVKPAVRIRYRDKHLSSHAGEVLSQEETRDSGYGAALNGGNNPWSPFNSKKDWEFAKWAKLRGVGSTAFSDLLAIDGVIFMHFVIIDTILILLIGLRSRRPFLQKFK